MYRKIGDDFTLKIVKGEFQKAHSMLSEPASGLWTANNLKAAYEEMIEYFAGAEVKVITNWQEIGDVQLDHGVMIYVPVESMEGSEAVSVVINKTGKITSVEFGRP